RRVRRPRLRLAARRRRAPGAGQRRAADRRAGPGAGPFRVPDGRRVRLAALRLRDPARGGPGADPGRRARGGALPARAGGPRHRPRAQDPRLQPARAGPRYRRSKRRAGAAGRRPRVRDRVADPDRPGRAPHAPAHEQPIEVRCAGRLRAGDRRAGAAGRLADARERALPADQAGEARPRARTHLKGAARLPTYEGTVDGTGVRVGIVVARFNELITRNLLNGARDALRRGGVADDDVTVAWVPGSFEIPLVAKTMACSGRYDAVVCLGAVIRGATAHFDHVAGQAASGVARAGLDTGVPVIFGILTTD